MYTRYVWVLVDSRWQQCLTAYLRGLETRSVATRVSYAGILRRFLAQYEPDTVTRREVEDFMYSASTRGMMPAIATMNARLAAIGGLYRFASSYIPEGETEPLWTRAIPTVGITRGKPERSPRGLSLEELSRLFDQISDVSEIGIRDKALLLFYLYSARRRSELASIRYGDIQPATFPGEHGHTREGWIYHFRGKGHKEVLDSQELPQPVKDAIDWMLISSGRDETIRPSDPLFIAVGREPGYGGNVRSGEVRTLSAKGIANRIRVYAEQAGLKASLHTLRHSSAKMRYASGEDVMSIQALLRHSNLQTTFLYLQGLTGTADPGYKLLESKFDF